MQHRGLWPIIVCMNHDLDLFYGKVNIGHIGFSMGKWKTLDFSGSFVACDLKAGIYI